MNATGPNARLLVTSEECSEKTQREEMAFLFLIGAGEELTLQAAFHFLTHLPLLKRDETVSGCRFVQHFGKRKSGRWCNCLIDSVAGLRGLVYSVSQDVRREMHC